MIDCMPRLTEQTRARRRQHILTSAWKRFSRDGFHVTSMNQVVAETGMSSSAVYRYFRSKEEIMHGLIVMPHLVADVSPDAFRAGVALLGAAADLNRPTVQKA